MPNLNETNSAHGLERIRLYRMFPFTLKTRNNMLHAFDKGRDHEKGLHIRLVLAADIGATKTNLALFKWEDGKATVEKEGKFSSRDYPHIIRMADEFLKNLPLPDHMCFGVAGPVLAGKAKMSNLGWEVDSREIGGHFGVKNVALLNDLEAAAYGLAMMDDQDFSVIHKGSGSAAGNAAVIAPGTGLGEAGLYWDGNSYHPFATEGGHSDFAPRDKFDFELYSYLHDQFGHVSWERLLCGPGIWNIYRFLRDEMKREEPGWLAEQISEGDAAAVISGQTARAGICRETMQLFIRYLAYEAANLVLKMKATGGLYIGGGIAPQIIPQFEEYLFYANYLQSGRLNYLLENVPLAIILNTRAPLLGASWYGYYKMHANGG